MPSCVGASLDLHLEEGMTYIYHITQTQVMQVTVISASRISVPPDSRAHSSRELEISLWRTTKSLESTHDNLHKHLRNQQVKPIFSVITFWKAYLLISFFTSKSIIFFWPQLKQSTIPVETILHYQTRSIRKSFQTKFHTSLCVLFFQVESKDKRVDCL